VCKSRTNPSGYNISAQIAWKTPLVVLVQSFPWEHVFFRSRYSATALEYLLSNGSTFHNVNIKLSTKGTKNSETRKLAKCTNTILQGSVSASADLCKWKLDNISIIQKENSRNVVPTPSSWIHSPGSETKYRHTFRITSGLTEGIERQKHKNDNRYSVKDFFF
jgi:hypothetical protein